MAKQWNKNKDGKPSSDDQALGTQSKEDITSRATGKQQNKPWKGKNNGKPFRKGTNDPNWYVANPSIVKDVANIPFAVYNGLQYNMTESVSTAMFPSGHANWQTNVPGVAAYKYIPWYGTATPTSSLNLTMRALYSFVRHVNSGRTNYEAPDLMLYIMAMDNIYLIIHEIKRFIRLAYLYVLENRNVPEKIYSLLNLDLSDVVGNLANYRAQINVRIAKANSLAVPANFNLFKRRSVMGSVVLSDEPNRPTELIIPKADGYYKFNATANNGGKLEYVMPGLARDNDTQAKLKQSGGTCVLTTTKHTLNDYFRLLDDMLSVLLSDEDINIMSGDIIKAYGDNLFRLPFLEANEIQDIIHDENLLLQFTNSTVLDIPGASFSYDSNNVATGFTSGTNLIQWSDPTTTQVTYQARPVIGQRGGSLVAECSIDVGIDLYNQRGTKANQLPLLIMKELLIETSNANAISPENILEWTRLTMAYNKSQTAANRYVLEAGVEIGLGWLVNLPESNVNLLGLLHTERSIDKNIIHQWFQFGARNIVDGKVQLPSPDGLDSSTPKSITYVIEEGINSNIMRNGWIRRFNSVYASKFMEGLNFGPRAYEAGFTQIVTSGAAIYGDLSIGKLYEKTAVASRNNITAMHDAALLGLISSPYVTTSK